MTDRDWGTHYDSHERLYSRLADVVLVLIRQQLEVEQIKVLSVTSRIKEKSTYLEKIERKRYKDPATQLTDFAGIRVVTYLPDHVDKICSLIREFFDVDEENTEDKAHTLGTDRVGYQSKHFVCWLGRSRSKLPEYRDIHSLKFEIQIRTVLQHAWADLAHGKSYKFSARLPDALQRKLNLHAGNLELVDIGLNDLSNSIDEYSAAITNSMKRLRAEPVNAISLADYINTRFTHLKGPAISPSKLDLLVDEVKLFGIEKIGELDDLIEDDSQEAIEDGHNTLSGAVRLILVWNNLERYFSNSWNEGWHRINRAMYNHLSRKYSSEKIDKIFEDRDIEVYDDE